MADVKISDLPAASNAAGTQEFEVNDSGTSRKVTGNQLDNLLLGTTSGLVARTGTNARAARTITAGNGVIVSNGNGVSGNPTIAVDKATDANLHAGAANKIVDAAGVYSASAPVSLTDGATITPDFDAGRIFTVTLGGNRTLANATNQAAGQSGFFIIKQDATGSRTLSYGANYKFAGGAPDLSTDANAIDVISYYVEADGAILCTFAGAFA